MSRPNLMVLAEQERTDLLTLVRDLTDEEWNAPTLCARWSVRDVATHIVSYDELSLAGLVGTFLRGGIRVSCVNAVALKALPGHTARRCHRPPCPQPPPERATGRVRWDRLDRRHHPPPGHPPRPQTSTGIPPDRLGTALDFALGAPTLPARKNAQGLKLTATDLVYAAGKGSEVRGPGEALLMAIAGRPHFLDELTGPGLSTLRSRVE